MFEFILTNILMVALGVILYLAVRTLPRLEEEPGGESKSLIERWVASELPEKIDVALNSFTEKFLRKVKVLLLKVDNALSGHLKRIKPENSKPASAIDFKEITEQNKNGENRNPENSAPTSKT